MDPSTQPPTREPGPKLLAFTMVTGHGLKHLYSAAFSVVFPEIKVGLGLSNLAAGSPGHVPGRQQRRGRNARRLHR